jgi:hypothetical protein
MNVRRNFSLVHVAFSLVAATCAAWRFCSAASLSVWNLGFTSAGSGTGLRPNSAARISNCSTDSMFMRLDRKPMTKVAGAQAVPFLCM